MRKAFFAAAVVVGVSACGGGGGGGVSFKDPDKAQFTYGTSAPATGGEPATADAAAGGVSGAIAVAAESDPTAAQDQVLGLAMLANDMGDVFPGGVPEPMAQAPGGARAASLAAPQRLARAYLGASVVSAPTWDNPECWTLTATKATFDHCKLTETDTSGTVVVGLDGALTRAAGQMTWDITLSESGSGSDGGTPVSISFSDRLRGDIAWTASTYGGFSRSDIALAMSSGGTSVSAAVTYNADYDLTYTTDPSFCLTGGTVTLKRLWAQVPHLDGTAPTDPADYTDAAVQLTWVPGDPGACATGVNVAWGTPN